MTWILVAATAWLPVAVLAALLVGRSIRMVDPAPRDVWPRAAEGTSADLVDDELIRRLLTEPSAADATYQVRPTPWQQTPSSSTIKVDELPRAGRARGTASSHPLGDGTSPSQNPG